jgi:aminoglycoside 3-N-acetyltransferase I
VNYSYQRLADPDVELLKKLLKLFGEVFGETDTYQGAVPSDDYLHSLLAKPHFIAVAALRDGGVVGGLAAYQLDKFEQDRREIFIYDLAVAEDHRRRGVATGLINKLKLLARARQAYLIFVQADAGDEPAIRLYESFGIREDIHHFDIPVEGDS